MSATRLSAMAGLATTPKNSTAKTASNGCLCISPSGQGHDRILDITFAREGNVRKITDSLAQPSSLRVSAGTVTSAFGTKRTNRVDALKSVDRRKPDMTTPRHHFRF